VRAQGNAVDVVEFYNATLDHYFISSLAADIQALDSGALKGWSRTGLSFKAYDGPTPARAPCAGSTFPPRKGLALLLRLARGVRRGRPEVSGFSYESPSVMHVGLPDLATGACGPGMAPVYRLWNNRADSNHRYTADAAVRSAMVAKGYIPEGYGSEGVAMCAALIHRTVRGDDRPGLRVAPSRESRDVWSRSRRATGSRARSLGPGGSPGGVTLELSSASLGVG
jgi:hypothetical protein